tara:strand:+ start:524 stop:895 length:372 start_codon:yes stop_codon:yes gene_type:complete
MSLQLTRPPLGCGLATAGLWQGLPDIPEGLASQFVSETTIHERDVFSMPQPQRLDLASRILLELCQLRLIASLELLDLLSHLSHLGILSLARVQFLLESVVGHRPRWPTSIIIRFHYRLTLSK